MRKKKKKAQMRLISPFTDFSIYQVVFLNSMITKSRVPELETKITTFKICMFLDPLKYKLFNLVI